MNTIKVIHQVSENRFEVKTIEYFWPAEIASKKEALGVTYDDVRVIGWNTKDYPAGKFVIKWHTNFDYGKQTFADAHIFYLNMKKKTKTFIDFIQDVPNLEAVATLMNKYANINNEQLWDLFENSVDRLGHYHKLHRQQYDNTKDTGSDYADYNVFDKADFDSKCYGHIQGAQAVAVRLQKSITRLHRMTDGIGKNSDPMISRIIEDLRKLREELNVRAKPIFYNGRLGEEHIVGDMSWFEDYTLKR